MRRRNRKEWATLVAGYERGSLTVAQFALRHGVRPSTLSWWAWRLRREAVEEAPRLLPVRVIASTAPLARRVTEERAGIEVELPDQVRLRFSDGALIEQIVAIVQQLRRC
jgi:transposase-like protein